MRWTPGRLALFYFQGMLLGGSLTLLGIAIDQQNRHLMIVASIVAFTQALGAISLILSTNFKKQKR